jgi:hypothetical protein
MSESLERWNQGAPGFMRDAASLYGQEGPSELELERMLAHVERTAAVASSGTVTHAAVRVKLGGKLVLAAIVLGLCGMVALRAPNARPSAAVGPLAGPFTPGPIDAPPAPVRTAAVESNERATTREADERPAQLAAPKPAVRRPDQARVEPLDELTLLVRARRLLGRDPERAYALTEQHRQGHRRGTLSEERELLAIEALLALGRRTAAEARARQFARRYPSSVHARKLALILSAGAQ